MRGRSSGYPFRVRLESGAGGDRVKLLAVDGQSVDLGGGDEEWTVAYEEMSVE